MDGDPRPMTQAAPTFDPAADPRAFRHALGAFATGVTIVTAATDAGPVGITANSFSSVSLDPPLILWCPAKSSSRYDIFTRCTHFAVHVLGQEQKWISDAFVRDGRAFDRLTWAPGPGGAPLIEGTLARFDCRLTALHDAGDHAIVVGHVLSAVTRPGTPLVFQGGRYTATA